MDARCGQGKGRGRSSPGSWPCAAFACLVGLLCVAALVDGEKDVDDSDDAFGSGSSLDPTLTKRIPTSQVEYYPKFLNRAAGAYAWQSTTVGGAEAKFAVDGVVEQDPLSGLMAITREQDFPWWQVDLGKVEEISNVTIFTRNDGGAADMKAFYVIITEAELSVDPIYDVVHRKDAFKVLVPEPLGYSITVDVGKRGRFIMIAKLRKGSLSLAEVQVWGPVECPLVCLKGKLDPVKCRCDCINAFTGTHCDECSENCQHGGTLDSTVCLCGCNRPWGGNLCDKCERTCKFGTLDEENCMCECPLPWTGPECERCSLDCSNGSVPDMVGCTCKCIGNWHGSECKYCMKSCRHGGVLDFGSCTCKCPYPWSGNRCQTCAIQSSCHNGGILDEGSCSCQCPFPYTGEFCETCSLSCGNGGILDPKTCSCKCGSDWRPEDPGLGHQCNQETCTLQCMHGGESDSSSCVCACTKDWTGDQCEGCNHICENGGFLDRGSCTCECQPPWTGELCEVCPLRCDQTKATEDYANCACKCNAPWDGPSCQHCGQKCVNGGYLHRETCSCVCTYPWGGKDCGTCMVKQCGEHGELMKNLLPVRTDPHTGKDIPKEEMCGCLCHRPWTGGSCNICPLRCSNMGVLDEAECTCKCRAPWAGDDCSICGLKCQNGGELNRETCSCHCFPPHGGLRCELNTWVNDAKAPFFIVSARMLEVIVRGKSLEDGTAFRKGSYHPFAGAFSPSSWLNQLSQALGCSPNRLIITNITERNPVDVNPATGRLGRGALVYVVDMDIVDVTDAKRLPAMELEMKMRRMYNSNALRNELRIIGITGKGWRNRTEKTFWISVLKKLTEIEGVARNRAKYKEARIKRWLDLYKSRESMLNIALHAFAPGFNDQKKDGLTANSEKVPELFRLPWKADEEHEEGLKKMMSIPDISDAAVPESEAASGAEVQGWDNMSDQEVDDSLLALVNKERSQAQQCHGINMPAGSALSMNQQLSRAAAMHAASMAEGDFVSHTDKMGRTYSDRLRLVNFVGHTPWGEMLGKGTSSKDVVQGWVRDDCENLLKKGFTMAGIAHYKGFWVMELATGDSPGSEELQEALTPA